MPVSTMQANATSSTSAFPADRAKGTRYVVVTPAKNEAAFIELTLKSVIAQNIHPMRWVIVSDGSTDNTDEIVRKYAMEYDWIELLSLPESAERNFSGKVHAFSAGYEKVRELDYDFIVSMDADVSFDRDFFPFLLERFKINPRLGLAGAPFIEQGKTYDFRFSSTEHVSGICQIFRRECFQSIGGYVPVKGGGIDVIAVMTARMKGWETRTFPEKVCEHHRSMGTGMHSNIGAKFKLGQKDYALGNSPVWQIFRSAYQMTKKTFIIDGCAIFSGYFWCMLRGVERPVSAELMQFRRREQWGRLRKFFLRGWRQDH